MGRRLVAFVTVDGVQYGPDSDVPADVAKQIDNPKAWGDEPDAEGDEKPKRAPRTPRQK